MNDLLIFTLLFVAIATGWYLGRRSSVTPAAGFELPGQTRREFRVRLEDHAGGAIDSFIGALEVNSETFETHVELGNLLRRKGEVDGATRVHQNLLTRPGLPSPQLHLAYLELARDYISAGLLDRAEALLLDLVGESPQQRRVSQRHLLEIYQSERDWPRAIEVARGLLPLQAAGGASPEDKTVERGQDVGIMISHYCCELAAEKSRAGERHQARALLREALAQDDQCVRASLMLGELEADSGHYRKAIKALRAVGRQDPDFLPETIALLRKCHGELGDERGFRDYFEASLERAPTASLVLARAEYLLETEGSETAGEFLSGQLAERPSLRGLSRLISLHLQSSEGKAREDLDLLQVLVSRLISERPAYRCTHCGFSGRHLHWLCPGCKYWGTVKLAHGPTAE